MELTYMARGADRKEYGPVTLEQLKTWIQEGRLGADQELKRSDMDYWAPARDFAEVQPVIASGSNNPGPVTTAASRPAGAVVQEDAAVLAQLKSSASWFYWIAGLSLVNSIAAFSGSSWRFIFGLGVTQVFDAFGASLEGAGKGIVLVLDLVAAGIFVLFGVFAHKRQAWAFIVGMLLFALDGLVMLLFQDWVGMALHGVVLFFLFRGFQACRQLKSAA
jgi:hypothetical protein